MFELILVHTAFTIPHSFISCFYKKRKFNPCSQITYFRFKRYYSLLKVSKNIFSSFSFACITTYYCHEGCTQLLIIILHTMQLPPLL
uniref:Uncharacterized protein n=1 Tax=Lepeophtheirus salmonis TaxID=72036 RepID=A0A0K2U0L5_LEPSM